MQNPLPLRLKTARKKAGLTQQQLGMLLGMEQSSASARMNQYEKGKHAPDYQTMQRIAAELGLPVAYFYCEDELLAELICAISTLNKEEQSMLLTEINQKALNKKILESQYELLQSLIDGTISFKDECNTREIVNLLCQSCIDSSDDIDIYSFFGSSSAGDIDELLIEELQYNGWDVEWFDLFATGIDVVALSEAITATHFVPYSKDEIESFIFDFLENWKSNTMKYIHVQLTGNREE